MERDKTKGFVLGALTVILFSSIAGTVFAAGKLTTIQVVMGGIKLYVDGKLVIPTDATGRVVEPFIYDGTTYLPLRALSNALTNNEKPVKWDGETNTIYIGKVPVAAQTNIAELEPYETNSGVLTGEKAIFQILDKEIAPFNRFYPNSCYGPYISCIVNPAYYTYMLHSQYRSLHGEFVIPYTTLGSTESGYVQFYNVNRYGEETLIAEYRAKAGDDPIKVEVNLQGIEILKIKMLGGAFYNVTLAGME